MTNRQLGELAIGVLAIYVALLGVLFVPMWVASAVTSRGISFGALIRNLVPIVLYLALASTLWFRRKNLASRAFEVPEASPSSSDRQDSRGCGARCERCPATIRATRRRGERGRLNGRRRAGGARDDSRW